MRINYKLYKLAVPKQSIHKKDPQYILKKYIRKNSARQKSAKIKLCLIFLQINYKTKTSKSFTNCSEEKEPVDSVGI